MIPGQDPRPPAASGDARHARVRPALLAHPLHAAALGLTERELTILGALARGLSNDEIAKEFWVAPQTVKFHLSNIYRKLGVKNRTEATRIAYQHGLVESPIYADE